jgi:hypothetical protein
MKPSDYYFSYAATGDGDCFAFVGIDFWKANKYLDDSVCMDDVLPEEFFEIMSATYEFDGDPDEGIKLLLELGFQQSKELDDFLSGQ